MILAECNKSSLETDRLWSQATEASWYLSKIPQFSVWAKKLCYK